MIHENFEIFAISFLEISKDPSRITLTKVLNTLQAQEQRRLIRQEGPVEGAFQAKSKNNNDRKKKKRKQSNKTKFEGSRNNKYNN